MDDRRQPAELDEESLSRLRKFNLIFGAVHGAVAIIIAILVGRLQADNTIPWYSNLANARPQNGPIRAWTPNSHFLVDVPIGAYSPIFIGLAALNHLLSATILRGFYNKNIALRRNPIRWFEYSVSASVMHVHVAMQSGVFDVHMLFLIFGLTSTTMFFGWLAEPDEEGSKPSFRAFWTGFIPYAYQWLVIGCYFFSTVSKGSPPGFVWAIIIIIFILDCSFAVVLYLQLIRWKKFEDIIYAEVAFMILSFCSKQLLCWINFGGTQSLKN